MEIATTIDSYLSQSIKLLHSSAPDSAEKMRSILEQEIIKNYDKSKTLQQTLTKKQMESIYQSELKAVGSGFKKKKKSKKDIKKIETPIINENHQIIKIRDDEDLSSDDEDESTSAIDLLSDLTCVSCRIMDSSANNQLFECVECGQLYHQLCHPTKIPSDISANSWTCFACSKTKRDEGSNKSTKSYDSSPSSSSNNSNIVNNNQKEKEKEKEKVIKEKEHEEKDKKEKRKAESKSSSKSSKKSKESSSSSSSRSRSSKK